MIAVFNKVSKNQNKPIITEVYIIVSQRELKVKTTSCLKRGKMRMVLVLHLIGREDGARFLDQSQSTVE